MSRSIDPRARLLRSLLASPHRFRRVRAATASLSVLLTAAVPLAGVGRLDLWGGRHVAFGAPAHPVGAVIGLGIGVFGFALLTLCVNAVGGRLFCGYGCPLAFSTRLAEASAAAGDDARRRRRAALARAAYAGTMGAVLLLWVVDPAVFARGSWAARAAAAAGWAGIAGAFGLHGSALGWTFCRTACPVGLYYTVVAPTRSFGIRFDRALSTCVDCGACDRVCPVALPPRDLLAPVHREEGLAPAGAPGVNHCLSCGDCVEACERVMAKRGTEPPLAFAWWPLREGEGDGGAGDAGSPPAPPS